jgi:beta-fructofuranosidase
MHLYRPEAPYFAGDCMPFWHDGVFHLYYLLDENHHQGNGGLGGHQWAHASTRDLLHWHQHPLALPISAAWEASICTGSTFWHDGLYYAFYATRKPDRTQHLCLATSRDGIHFDKSPANPFASAPEGYGPYDLRDPFVFRDPHGGGFHLLATAKLEPYPLEGRGGCLLHYTSGDLLHWTPREPFLIPGGPAGYACVPECPDLFEWNGWYYLLFSQRLETHYRYSRSPFGPWLRPPVDLLDSRLAAVMKTAPFGDQRRIGAAFIGMRKEGLDSAPIQWAGNVLLRELVQQPDGRLGTRFVPESQPAGTRLSPTFTALCGEASCQPAGPGGSGMRVCISAPAGQGAALLSPVPPDFSLRCTISIHLPAEAPCPTAADAASLPHLSEYYAQSSGRLGLGLRGSGAMASFVELGFEPALGKAWLGEQVIEGVSGLQWPFTLEVRCQGDIVEACIDGQRCLANRLGELRGGCLFLTCQDANVSYDELVVSGL